MATSMSLDTTTFSLNGETWTIIKVFFLERRNINVK